MLMALIMYSHGFVRDSWHRRRKTKLVLFRWAKFNFDDVVLHFIRVFFSIYILFVRVTRACVWMEILFVYECHLHALQLNILADSRTSASHSYHFHRMHRYFALFQLTQQRWFRRMHYTKLKLKAQHKPPIIWICITLKV